MSGRVISILAERAAKGEASRNGLEFARFIKRIYQDEPEAVVLASYLACAVIEDSHTCLGLDNESLSKAAASYGASDLDTASVPEAVKSSKAAGIPGALRPLILHDGNLYLHRYFSYEQFIARKLKARAAQRCQPQDIKKAAELAAKLFPKGAVSPDWQKIAAFNALFRKLTVISGGPGTGKTRTVTALMALLAATAGPDGISILMCAPTGKAAARLSESVSAALSILDIPEGSRDALPKEAKTLHRLLGAGRQRGKFRYNRENPLPCSVLIMDEASMVDLPMMVHLIEALRDEASLIMLGDKDQLASVEAGSVLRDICEKIDQYGYSSDFAEICREIGEDIYEHEKISKGPTPPIRDCIITLKHSYRFAPDSGIAALASSVNQGDFSGAEKTLNDENIEEAQFAESTSTSLSEIISGLLIPHAINITRAASPRQALDALERFKVLCGMKQGPSGVDAINSMVHSMLRQELKGSRDASRGLYRGLPVIVNRNDYMLELYNGDTGVVWPDENGVLRVWFMNGSEEIRSFAPARLPAFEPAWAITVHRSQGSEFDRVLFILPPEDSLMPGRELLYTAVTRAREQITVWGSVNDLKACIKRRTLRNSGLAKAVWEE